MSKEIYSFKAKATNGKSPSRPNGLVPLKASSLVFPAEVKFQQKQVSGDIQSVPVTLVARTDSVVDTWMGTMVHDLSGMFHKEKVPLDWRHEGDQLIGFLDTFQVSDKEIRCSGQVVSVEPGDIASQIISWSEAGVPLEASIFFGGQGLEVEEVPAEKEVKVNGKPFSGPGLVFRKWPMRGVALCPYGRDQDTSVTFKMEGVEEKLPALILTFNKEKKMSDNVEKIISDEAQGITPDALADATEALNDAVEVVDAATDVVEALGGETIIKKCKHVDGPISPDGLSGPAFIEAFGDNGAVWFAEGMTFAEATVLYITNLRDRVGELEEKLASLKKDSGGSEALDAEDDETESEKVKSATAKRADELTLKIGPNLAKFAAGLKIRK